MTKKAYFDSDETETTAAVTDSYQEDGKFFAILDRTIFHPQGGGQPSDTGWIGAARVLQVLQAGQQIIHVIDAPAAKGPCVLRVDAERRMHHARLHTAGHLIGNIGLSFGCSPVKAHHWPGEGKVTFDIGNGAAAVGSADFQEAADRLVAENLPRITASADGLRTVGFGTLHAFACGGTHVASLKQLGAILITAVKQKKGQLSVCYDLS